MSRPAFIVSRLGKSYRLGSAKKLHPSFRDALVETARSSLRRLRRVGSGGASRETFWALRDVSFEVQPGEVVGIIGRNGAGKSTLLKVLSRITHPTEGEIRLRGRVASLLEVGTGFHPELTGRENIYLNGSILGMRKFEIDRKFDEIVAFAEVEKFLDTATKHYSSGMYIRLAFSVAAHLEPQVLIVDEVLAVGDGAFQKKCLRKMENVTKEGRTVLFVSHNMPAVQNLCTRCILMERGRLRLDGDPETVLTDYNRLIAEFASSDTDLTDHPGRVSGSIPTMTRARVVGRGRRGGDLIHMGDDLSVQVEFAHPTPMDHITFGLCVKNSLNVPIFGVNTLEIPPDPLERPVRRGTISCLLEKNPLMPGSYTLDLSFGKGGVNFDVIHDACQFEIHPADVFGSGRIPQPGNGHIFWPATWTIAPDESAGPRDGNGQVEYADCLRDPGDVAG